MRRSFERALRSHPTAYIDTTSLKALLADYQNPVDRIARLAQEGTLIRLKRGLFLIADHLEGDLPFEQIGNILYGPSYVSLEWALAFYHLIPERVATVTCVTTSRTKAYATPIGRFEYSSLSVARFRRGYEWKEGGYLIASPEKALLDFIYLRCRGKELEEELLVARRMPLEELKKLDRDKLFDLACDYPAWIARDLKSIL